MSFQVSQTCVVLSDGTSLGVAPTGLAFLIYDNTTKRLKSSVDGVASNELLVAGQSGSGAALTNLNAANITSGVLAVANGGTGSSTTLNNNRIVTTAAGAFVEAAALTNGQLLIGSTGAAPVAASITAGSNVTVTNAAGSITVAAKDRIFLPYGNTVAVPTGGTLQLLGAGNTTVGYRLDRAGTITGASIQVSAADNARNYNLSIRVNGTEQATITLNNATGTSSAALSFAVAANDVITAFLVRTLGANASGFTSEAAVVEVTF